MMEYSVNFDRNDEEYTALTPGQCLARLYEYTDENGMLMIREADQNEVHRYRLCWTPRDFVQLVNDYYETAEQLKQMEFDVSVSSLHGDEVNHALRVRELVKTNGSKPEQTEEWKQLLLAMVMER